MAQIEVHKSKIHHAVVTQPNWNYFIENEKVQVVNVNNGERLDTLSPGVNAVRFAALMDSAREREQQEHRYCDFICDHEL